MINNDGTFLLSSGGLEVIKQYPFVHTDGTFAKAPSTRTGCTINVCYGGLLASVAILCTCAANVYAAGVIPAMHVTVAASVGSPT